MSQCFLKRQTVLKSTAVTAETVLAQLAEAPGDDRFIMAARKSPKRSRLNGGLSLKSV